MFAIASNSIGAVIIRTVLFAKLVTSLSTTTNRSHLTDGAMRCYSCTSTEEGSQCQTNPSTLPHGILDGCTREACTIVRVEQWPSQRVKSFYRGCDGRTKVFEQNKCQIEKDERTCFTACVGDLCNHGNGLVDHIVHSGSILTGSKADGWVLTVTTAVLLVFSAILLSENLGHHQ
ncbi:uncharacterized protein LOC124196069 isoform X1 [Daphnia pulex]|uniref:uncharacterized protein LOC124196069 isoform X1 n=1 Tax=Daphnia pulex TaxID=6669 RepID=UPI001EDCF561|nr:uncharacterized protein LOC124196069 isoform X1 [Daphnia pulex]